MESNGKVGFSIFFIIVIIIIVGGFYLMKKTAVSNTNTFNKNVTEEKEVDIRLDNTKDYIYFTDSNTITDELDITYQNVVINFEDTNKIADKLNAETEKFSKSLEYDDEWEDESYDKLVYAKFRKDNIYIYKNYISFVADTYTFDREDLVKYQSTKTYVFNKQTGELYTSDNLLKEFDLTKQDVLDKVEEYVEDQDLVKEDEELDAEATVDGIKTLNLYVDKMGRLKISVLVKSSQNDYNDSIILN